MACFAVKSMANKVIPMQQVRSVIQLLAKGQSFRAIAKELHLSRKTITAYATRFHESGYSLHELRNLDDAALSTLIYPAATVPAYTEDIRRRDYNNRIDYFLSELKRTGVTRLLLWQEYRKVNQQGYAYTQFCVLLSEFQKNSQAAMRIIHRPAQQFMGDFAGDELSYVDRSTGAVVFCPVLVFVLPFSDYTYMIALPDARIPQVIHALNSCVRFLGGVPFSFKTDNMKQVVNKPCRYEPVFTEALQQWSNFYDIALLATRVGKPRDKGAVENEVKIAYRRIYAPLRNQTFYSLQELNAAITHQLAEHNRKRFQKKEYSRLQLFEEQEKPLLQPLPAEDFVLKHRVEAKVQKNYHITLGEDWHHYSVPYSYIGKTVVAVYDLDHVEVYHQFQRIVLHRRSYKRHGFTTLAEHMPEGHLHFFEQQGWTADYFLQQAKKLGPSVYIYIGEVLKGRLFTEQTYNACRGLLRLEKQYGKERLDAACRRGLQGAVFNYRTIHNILINNLDRQAIDLQTELFRLPEHDNQRGPEQYQ
jgi:transposase